MVRVSPSAVAFWRLLQPIASSRAAKPTQQPARAGIDDEQILRATLIGTSDLAFPLDKTSHARRTAAANRLNAVLWGRVNAVLPRAPSPPITQTLVGDCGEKWPSEPKPLWSG